VSSLQRRAGHLVAAACDDEQAEKVFAEKVDRVKELLVGLKFEAYEKAE
jgi:hypothetical protein